VHHIKTTGLPSHHRQLQYDAESFLILRVRACPRVAAVGQTSARPAARVCSITPRLRRSP
jgi:hypothetical protein